MKTKRPVPLYYWPFWMACLALGLFVFYVLLTPMWMGIRFISWLAERRNMAEPGSARRERRCPGRPDKK
jgi:hypothetical protein